MNLLKYHWNSFMANPWRPKYLYIILATNIIGSIYGYYWYAEQLASTPKYLWLFIPDSPLSTTLFAVVLALSLAGLQSLLLSLAAFAGCIKYGIWAVIMITEFWLKGGDVEFEVAMLWISHMGMAAQGVIYFYKPGAPGSIGGFHSPLRGWGGALAFLAAWMFLNDFFDYGLGIYPYLYYYGQEYLAMVSAFSLSAVIMAFVILYFRRFK